MEYPDNFIDQDGYEWERGPFIIGNKNIKETHMWRFRYAEGSIPRHVDNNYWDYASDQQLRDWNIISTEEL